MGGVEDNACVERAGGWDYLPWPTGLISHRPQQCTPVSAVLKQRTGVSHNAHNSQNRVESVIVGLCEYCELCDGGLEWLSTIIAGCD
jgi:hypothetical protein